MAQLPQVQVLCIVLLCDVILLHPATCCTPQPSHLFDLASLAHVPHCWPRLSSPAVLCALCRAAGPAERDPDTPHWRVNRGGAGSYREGGRCLAHLLRQPGHEHGGGQLPAGARRLPRGSRLPYPAAPIHVQGRCSSARGRKVPAGRSHRVVDVRAVQRAVWGQLHGAQSCMNAL